MSNILKEGSYPNPWTKSDGSPLEPDEIKGYAGFVYLITHIPSGKKYVGRKYFKSTRKVKGKDRRQSFESDWQKYYGSNDELKALVKEEGEDNFKREILHLGKTKGEVNFTEVREQFARSVLESEDYYNDNINGKWYKKNVMRYNYE